MEDGVNNASRAAKQLRMDHASFLDYFTEDHLVSQFLGRAGYYSEFEVRAKFGLLSNMANLVNPDKTPDLAMEDVKAVMSTIDTSGSPTVLHLIGLRKRHQDEESAEWLRVLGEARKAISVESDDSDKQHCEDKGRVSTGSVNMKKLPTSLDDSKYVQNVSAGYFVQRRLSANTAAALTSTRNLLRSRATGLNMIRQWDYNSVSSSKTRPQIVTERIAEEDEE